ncbi:GNAT family N-acetyltransferase [Microbacterium aquimaris]
MMHPVVLSTDRFVLSVPVADDVDAVFAACQDPEIQRWTTVPSPYERRHAVQYCTTATAQWEKDAEQLWAVREGAELCGVIGLHRTSPDTADLGYWVAPTARGRGVLTEAAREVLDWGFAADGGGYARIGWRAVVGNLPSARAARALGFEFEGTSRMALPSPRGREDAWFAGLLPDDDRAPRPWPVLDAAIRVS